MRGTMHDLPSPRQFQRDERIVMELPFCIARAQALHHGIQYDRCRCGDVVALGEAVHGYAQMFIRCIKERRAKTGQFGAEAERHGPIEVDGFRRIVLAAG